jgi:hypothetical protein
MFMYDNRDRLTRLNNSACIQAYSSPLQRTHGSVLVVVASNATNDTVKDGFTQFDKLVSLAYCWLRPKWPLPNVFSVILCVGSAISLKSSSDGVLCDTTGRANANNLTVSDYPIDYCLSSPIDEHCRLQFSVVIVVVVIFFNFVKMCCMMATFMEPSPTLVTIGDAIDSFLQRPDPRTAGNCTASWASFTREDWRSLDLAQPFKARRYWWFQATTRRRLLLCNIL